MLDFLVANSGDFHEFVSRQKQARETQRQDAWQRFLEGKLGDDESGFDTERHPRRRRADDNVDADLATKTIQDQVNQMQTYMQKVMNATLSRDMETDPDVSPFVKEIVEAPLPVNFHTAPVLESYDGLSDPHDHLYHCITLLKAYKLSKENMCTMIPTTFRQRESGSMTWHQIIFHPSMSFGRNSLPISWVASQSVRHRPT